MAKGKIRKSFRDQSAEQLAAFEDRQRRSRKDWERGTGESIEDWRTHDALTSDVAMLPALQFSPGAWLQANARSPELLTFITEAALNIQGKK